jgi:hypothetical protein
MGMRTKDEEAEPTKKKAFRDFKGLESGNQIVAPRLAV